MILDDIHEGDNMSIKLKVDRIKKYKLNGIDALHIDNLPEEYILSSPYIYKYGKGGRLCILSHINNETNERHFVNISIGDEFTESEMRILIHHIRLARERLGRINQKIKRDNDKKKKETLPKPSDDWSGSYTFEV